MNAYLNIAFGTLFYLYRVLPGRRWPGDISIQMKLKINNALKIFNHYWGMEQQSRTIY